MQVFDDGITYCNCGVCEPLVDCSAVPLHPSCECDRGPIDCAPLGEDAVDCDGLPWNTIFGACRVNDDYVDVSFTVNVDAKAEYDAGMYIATDGGHCKCVHLYCFCVLPPLMMVWRTQTRFPFILAITGDQCMIATLTRTGYESIVDHVDVDLCYDFYAAGVLYSYPFERIRLMSCTDAANCSSGTCVAGQDRLLDFHVSASFKQGAGV